MRPRRCKSIPTLAHVTHNMNSAKEVYSAISWVSFILLNNQIILQSLNHQLYSIPLLGGGVHHYDHPRNGLRHCSCVRLLICGSSFAIHRWMRKSRPVDAGKHNHIGMLYSVVNVQRKLRIRYTVAMHDLLCHASVARIANFLRHLERFLVPTINWAITKSIKIIILPIQ